MKNKSIEYYPSRGTYIKFFIKDKKYQVLPTKILREKGLSPAGICDYCKKGFNGECPQFKYAEEVMACSGNDRRDGEEIYFEWDENNFLNLL